MLDLDGYEGPIDLLLSLAREQKVDLAKISILALADQYLGFIAAQRQLKLDIAADYLVMAAWLAYLKSRLLLPQPSRRRRAGRRGNRRRTRAPAEAAGGDADRRPETDGAVASLGQDFFLRGAPEGLATVPVPVWRLELYDLLRAYGSGRRRTANAVLAIEPSAFYSMEDASSGFARFLGHIPEWRALVRFLPAELRGDLVRRSALASTFAAALELARDGRIELRQDRAFGPIWLRSRAAVAPGRRRGLPGERAGRSNCGSSRRCCSPPASRCRKRRWRSASATQPTSPPCCASLPSITTAAASTSCRLAGGWAFRTAPDLAPHLRIERPVARKLSRAAVETLAVIAYHQPVTRAEIEEIRGVALGKGTLDTLMEAGWVRPKGRRMTPGRPLLWVTTKGFLAHFGLDTLGDLPAIDELRAAGLLDLTPPVLGEEAPAAEGAVGSTPPLSDYNYSSFPRKRESRSSDVPLSLDPSPDLWGSRGRRWEWFDVTGFAALMPSIVRQFATGARRKRQSPSRAIWLTRSISQARYSRI